MAFITIDTRKTLSTALNQAQTTAAGLKRMAQRIRADCLAGNISGYVLTQELMPALVAADVVFADVSSQPGLAAFAQDQVPDQPSYDPAAEFVTMRNAVDGVGAWIIANIPKSGGKLTYETISATGVAADEFTPAQTAGLVTELDTLIATID